MTLQFSKPGRKRLKWVQTRLRSQGQTTPSTFLQTGSQCTPSPSAATENDMGKEMRGFIGLGALFYVVLRAIQTGSLLGAVHDLWEGLGDLVLIALALGAVFWLKETFGPPDA